MSVEGQKRLKTVSSIIASVLTDVTSLNDRFISWNKGKSYPLAMFTKQQEDSFLKKTWLTIRTLKTIRTKDPKLTAIIYDCKLQYIKE